MRSRAVFFALLCVLGCSSAPKHEIVVSSLSAQADTALKSLEVSLVEPSLSLHGMDIQQSRIETFIKDRKHISELDKIQYLLSSIRSSDAIFVRNGDEFKGSKAAGWLRWKMMHRQYKSDPIVTAKDFVERVCLQSNNTGFAYEVILPGGNREKLRKVMEDELLKLETAIQQKAMTEAVASSESTSRSQSQDTTVTVPVLLHAAK